MKKIKNIHFSSEKTNGKAMLWISIIFMLLIWLLLATVLTLLSLEALAMLVAWNLFLLAFVVFLLVLVVWLIPLQLIRYFRRLRALS